MAPLSLFDKAKLALNGVINKIKDLSEKPGKIVLDKIPEVGQEIDKNADAGKTTELLAAIGGIGKAIERKGNEVGGLAGTLLKGVGATIQGPTSGLLEKSSDLGQQVGEGKISKTTGGVGLVSNIGLGALQALTPKLQLVLNTALKTKPGENLTKAISEGREKISKSISDNTGISKETADVYTDVGINLATILAGIKGQKKFNEGFSNISKGNISQGIGNIAKGTAIGASPDIALSVIGNANKEDIGSSLLLSAIASGARGKRGIKVKSKTEPIIEEPVVKSKIEPVIEEPVVKSKTEPVVKSKIEPVVKSKIEPVVKSKTEPVVKSKTEPVVKSKTEPVVKSKTEPVVKSKTEPVVKSKTEPVVKSKTEPVVKSKTEPVVKSKTEPVVKSKIEPAVKSKTEPVVKSKIEPVVKSKTEPVVKAKTEPVVKAKQKSESQTFELVNQGLVTKEFKSKEPEVIKPSVIEPLTKDNGKPFGGDGNNIDNILNKTIDELNSNFKFELGIVQKNLQKYLPNILSNAIKNTGKAYIDIKNKLNNIMAITKEGVMGLGDLINSINFRKKLITDYLTKKYGLNDLAKWADENSKILTKTQEKLKNNLKELFTIDGKFDEIGYTVAKSHLKRQYFQKLFFNKNLLKLSFINNVYFYLRDIHGKSIINKLPTEIKSKIEEIDKKISVHYDKEGDIINPNSLEHQMYDYLGTKLENENLLKHRKESYIRGVILHQVYDKLIKHLKELKLEKIPEYNEYIKMGYDPTIVETGNIPKWLSSILKSSYEMRKFHSHDPITRMISYIDQFGQLLVNKQKVDLINKARLDDNDINRYIGKDTDKFVKIILGLDKNKTKEITGKIAGGLAGAAIIGNTGVLSMSTITTLVRSLPKGIKYIKDVNGITIKSIQEGIDFIRKIGLEIDHINERTLKKIYNETYSFFSGGTLDILTKGILANLIVKSHLKELGIEVKKGDNIFEIYQDTLGKKYHKYIAQLSSELSDISEFLNINKGQIYGLSSRIFNLFKSFSRLTISKYLSYPVQIVNETYSTLKHKLPTEYLKDRNIQKVSFLLADTIGIYLGCKAIVNLFFKDEDEDKKEILANRLAGGDIKERIAMLISYPLQQPGISMTVSTFNNIIKLATDIVDNGIKKDQIDYLKIVTIIRQLKELYGDKELTQAGIFKYQNKWGDNTIQNIALFMLGFSGGKWDYNTAVSNINKIKDKDKSLFVSVLDKIIKDQGYFSYDLMETKDIILYTLGSRDINNLYYKFIIRSTSKRNVNKVLDNIISKQNIPMTVEEYIRNAWDGFDIKVDDKKILTFLKNELKTDKTKKVKLMEVIGEIGVSNDPLYEGDMNKYMKELQVKNPKLFYQIIKKILGPVVIKIDKETNTIKDLEFSGKEPLTGFIDEILVDRFENLPRISSDIANRFAKIISEDSKPEDLASYNELIKATSRLPYLWNDIVHSIRNIIEEKLIDIPTDKLDEYPYIKQMLKLAAIDRGIKFIENNDNVNTNIPIGKKQGDNNELLKRMLSQPSIQNQQKWIDLLRGQIQQPKIQPLYSNNQNYRNKMIEILMNGKKF